MRRWLLATTVGVFALLPVGIAISASPGHGPGCVRAADGTFHGYCVHHKTVTKTHTATVRRTHTATATATEHITTGSTTTIPGTTTTSDYDRSRHTTTTTTTPTTSTSFDQGVSGRPPHLVHAPRLPIDRHGDIDHDHLYDYHGA